MDYNNVQSYLNKDPLHNIIPIHAFQKYGLVNKRVAFWGAYISNKLRGILYIDNSSKPLAGYLVSDNTNISLRLGKIALKSKMFGLLGKRECIQPIMEKNHSRIRRSINCFFYTDFPEQLLPYYDYPIRIATRKDIPMLAELYKDYEFSRRNRTDYEVKLEIQKVMDDSGIYFFHKIKGRAVCAASITTESDHAALIGAARTLPEFRKKGIYMSVRTACCEYVFNKGKIVVGYFVETNDNIKKIIIKQGGQITDKLVIINFKKNLRFRLMKDIKKSSYRVVKQIIIRSANFLTNSHANYK